MKKILSIILIFICILFTSCSYSVPENDLKQPHTYDEILEYAKTLDSNAIVEKEYTEVEEEYKTFRIWKAKINNIDCEVASVSDVIYDNSIGEFSKTFYKPDTSYDFIIINKTLINYPELGTITDSTLNRFHINDLVCSDIYLNDINKEKLESLWKSYLSINKELQPYNLHKDYWLCIHINNDSYYFTKIDQQEYQNVYDSIFK